MRVPTLIIHGPRNGECEIRADKVAGIAVNIGARVMSNPGPGEVLVSSTVEDLVAGSGITFDDRGPAALKGVDGQWRLYAVRDEADVHATAPALV